MKPEQSQLYRVKFIDEAGAFLRKDNSGLVAVLKAHLFAEQMLNAVIRSNLNLSAGKLDKCRFTFAQKIVMVVASENMSSNFRESLEQLNSLRNKCAHRYSFEIERKHWEEVFAPFESEMPYAEPVPENEEQKWSRWAFWVLGLLFPTVDVYVEES